MAKPCRVVVSPQLAKVLNLEPNQDLSYREWVQILHDGGLDRLTENALIAIEAAKKEAKVTPLQEQESEQKSINEPRNAKDVAVIFRKLFNFSPTESVWAARLFDAKAAFMSRIKGISKEDYYKQYWFGGELSQKGKELNQIVGENAQLAQDIRDNLQVARNMESAGKDAKTIRLATGWEKGADGKWRYEINPSELYFSLEDLTNAMPKGSATTELGKLIKNDALFKAYPQLKNLKIEIHNEPKSGLIAGYNPTSKEIFINLAQIEKLSKDKTKGESERSMLGLRELLGHEIQHIIQFEEGFAIGGGKNQGEKAFRSKFSEYAKQKGIKETNIEFENYLKNILGDKWKEYAYNGYLRLAGEVEARNVQARMNMTPEERKAKTLAETEDVAREEQIILFGGEKKGGLSQVEAWHGSPYAFDRFTTEKIGTGEGAQAFGWGLYFTDLKSIARNYAKKLSGDEYTYDGKPISKDAYDYLFLADDSLGENFNENTIKDISKIAIDKIKKDYIPDLKEIQQTSRSQKQRDEMPSKIKMLEGIIEELNDIIKSKEIKKSKNKNLYKVSLHKGKSPSEYTWLEWDKPLSEEQRSAIINQAKKEGFYDELIERVSKRALEEDYDGQFWYGNISSALGMMGVEMDMMDRGRRLKNDKEASLFLLRAGIDGIKYPAESAARGATSDTARGFNYVVFDENAVTIEERQLFQDRKGSWSKEAAKMKRLISMYEKADSTTQVHEVLGHDYLDEIIELSSTNEEFANDLDTIIDEYIKETGSKISKEKLLNDLKNFDVEKNKNKNGVDVHEWFAKSAERYFATERGVRTDTTFGRKMAGIFEKFRQHLADLYRMMSNELVEPSPAMKEIFRKVFGSENFTKAEEMRNAATERINSLEASELEKNKSKVKIQDILDKYKPKEGLGQISDEFTQDMYNLATELIKDGQAQRYNVTDKLQELMPHLKNDIEHLRKVLQRAGEQGKGRNSIENLLANPNILPEVKEKIQKLGEYTPEKMASVGLNAEQILSFYSAEKGNDIDGMAEVAALLDKKVFDNTTEKVALRQLLIANYNQLAKIAKDKESKERYVNLSVDQAEKYALEGTGYGRMVNMYKALGSLTSEGLIVWAKRQQNKYKKPAYEKLKSEIYKLKQDLKKAGEDIDYFLSEVLKKEDTVEKLQEEIADLDAQLEAAKKARKTINIKDKVSTAYKNVKDRLAVIKSESLSDIINDIKSSGLFQDTSNLTPAQKLAYYLMERKPMNIVQFAKEFSKTLDKKFEPSELKELYQQTRDMLVMRDIGFAEGLSANDELDKDLKDIEDTNRAKIEELERKKKLKEAKLAEKKAEAERKKANRPAKEPKSPAESLSDFILSDLRRAMKGTISKQDTYIEFLLKALTQKAKEVALKGNKTETAKTTLEPIEAIRKALDAIQNGKPDASIWNDAVQQVKEKIAQDNTLSQQDKDDLNLYLNDYTSFVYDNMLNDSVIFNAIKQSLINNGYGTGNNVNFRALISEGNKAEMFERQRLIEKIKSDLAQYDPVQVEKILDIVAERYQRLINEKRKQVAESHINNLLKGKSEKTKKAVRGKIGQLLVENRMGLFDDSNNKILDVIAQSKGMTNMTSADWVKLKELADQVEELPLGSNLQNEAIEEMVAFVRTKMPARWVQIATAVRYATLLGRITSNIKNALGGVEQAFAITGGRALIGDFEFFKAARRGFKQGDFRDILVGGGINQASKVSVEADNNGMPHFRIIEYLQPVNFIGKIIKSAKYSDRILNAMDAVWQKYFTSAYDIKYMRKLLEFENPNATKAEIDAKINEILSKENFDDYYDQALQDVESSAKKMTNYEKAVKDVIATGKKVTKAKVRRRTYEIMRESLIRPMARELSDLESTEKTYKTDFFQNLGVATMAGKIAEGSANLSKPVVEKIVKKIFEMKGYDEDSAAEQAKIYGSIIPNALLPFSKGLSGFIEKGLEREIVYGLAKSMIVAGVAKSKKATTIEDKMAQARAFEKAKDIATTAIFTNLILYGVGTALYALSKKWDDDEEKEGRKHPKTGLYGAAEKITSGTQSTVKEKGEPENVVVLFGRQIPLSYLGGLGVAGMIDANVKKAFNKEVDKKKTKVGEVFADGLNASFYIADSFLSQSYLMQTSENQDIKKLIEAGFTEKALNIIENSMINYGASYMVWSGLLNQTLQGTRAALGGDTYQEAKTTSEKIQKQFGLAGITYTNTKKNYLGEDIKYSDVNREGIVALVDMFKVKNITQVDGWLRDIGFKDRFKTQYSKALKDIDGYSPSVEEYDRFTDRTKVMFGKFAKEAYAEKSNINPSASKINPKTDKPYTVNEWQNKVMSDALSAISKYNLVNFKKERGDYNSDLDAYEEDISNALSDIDNAFHRIYYKKGVNYSAIQSKINQKISEIKSVK